MFSWLTIVIHVLVVYIINVLGLNLDVDQCCLRQNACVLKNFVCENHGLELMCVVIL